MDIPHFTPIVLVLRRRSQHCAENAQSIAISEASPKQLLSQFPSLAVVTASVQNWLMTSLLQRLRLRMMTAVLRRALSKPPPDDGVYRTGPEGERADFYSVRLDAESDNPKMVLTIEDGVLGCMESASRGPYSRLDTPISVKLSSVKQKDFSIRHYYGLADINFDGLIDFARSQIFPLVYYRVRRHWRADRNAQNEFNRNNLVSFDRLALLKFLIERQFEEPNGIGLIELMSELHTDRWVEHPDKERELAKLQMHLNSMVEENELSQTELRFQAKPKALRALEEYEERERKHSQEISIQSKMVWLTIALFFAAAVQAISAVVQAWADWHKP